ncbi:MAG: hypothetical protein PHH38_03525 [Candidatus Cloacimonetes bacterium]|nr:hypothetical protein [Candidatus Cloacimonadota bacterium]
MLNDMNIIDERKSEVTPTMVVDSHILLKVYLNKLKLILLVTLAALIIAVIFVKIKVVPSWKANCYIIRAPKNMSTPVEMPYLYQTFDINTILETVRTRDVLTDVIQKLELDISPEQLFRQIEVQRGNRSNVLRFSVSWNDAEISAKVANATAESFISNNTKLLNSATMKIHDYYLEQRHMRIMNIQDLEEQYEQYKAEYGVISIPHETQTKFDQLKEIEIKMIENSLRIKDMDSKIAEMNEKLGDVPEEVIQTWTYTQTDEKNLLALQKDLELLRARYTDENPKVRKVLQEIEELKTAMQEKKRDIPEAVTWGPSGLTQVYTIDKSRFEAERQGAIQMNEEYQKEISQIRSTLENLGQVQKDFFEIERQLELNRDILKLVESRLAESKMAMQSNVSDYEILEAAKAPAYPESSRRKLIVVGFSILVFLSLSIFIVIKEILDVHTKSAKDFHEVVRIPLCGILPNEHEVDERVFYRNMQVLVENIVHHTNSLHTPVICFGSDIRETGKSFIVKECINLLASNNKKILYIDSIIEATPDINVNTLNGRLYGLDKEIEIDKTDPFIHNAYFLVDDSTFTKVLETKSVAEVLKLFDSYDYVIWELFDYEYNIQLFTGICAAADTLVLVARFNRSSRNSLHRAVKFIKNRGLTNIHGVLNYVPKDFYSERY